MDTEGLRPRIRKNEPELGNRRKIMKAFDVSFLREPEVAILQDTLKSGKNRSFYWYMRREEWDLANPRHSQKHIPL
ncbi:MAG: hypothetical protein QXU18_06435 [Thermoplasmatales archaeon]